MPRPVVPIRLRRSPPIERVQLLEERGGVQHHAIAEEADGFRIEDAGGNQPEDELGISHDHGVAGIGPALVAHHQVGLLGEHVDQLAFSLVTPLRPDDNETRQIRTKHYSDPLRPFPLRSGVAPATARAVSVEMTPEATSSSMCC